MNNYVFIFSSYNATQAGVIRRMAIIRSLLELGNNVKIIVLNETEDFFKIPVSTNLQIVKAFRKRQSNSIDKISNILKLFSFINKNDIVFLYGYELILHIVVSIIGFFKSFIYLVEVTEHPDYSQSIGFIQRNKKPLFLFIVRNIVDSLFVISKDLKNYYVEKGIPEEKVSIVNMVVDFSRFDNIVENKSDTFTITYIGSISIPKDGVDYLIKSFSILKKEVNNVRLVIIGNFATSNDNIELTNLVDKLGINKFVHFIGSVMPNEVPHRLVNSDVLALARPNNKQASSGFPSKLGEYLCTGNPVVITNTGEIENFIIDGISGYLVKAESEYLFYEKLKYVYENYDKAKEVGSQGIKVAHKYFSSLSASIKIDEIVNNLIKK